MMLFAQTIEGKWVVTMEHDLMGVWFVVTGILLHLGIQPLGYGF